VVWLFAKLRHRSSATSSAICGPARPMRCCARAQPRQLLSWMRWLRAWRGAGSTTSLFVWMRVWAGAVAITAGKVVIAARRGASAWQRLAAPRRLRRELQGDRGDNAARRPCRALGLALTAGSGR